MNCIQESWIKFITHQFIRIIFISFIITYSLFWNLYVSIYCMCVYISCLVHDFIFIQSCGFFFFCHYLQFLLLPSGSFMNCYGHASISVCECVIFRMRPIRLCEISLSQINDRRQRLNTVTSYHAVFYSTPTHTHTHARLSQADRTTQHPL